MRPTLRQLEYFVAVADFGAFGQAAAALSVTQPSLSKQIAALEDELGLTLFERTSRRLQLTRSGAALLEMARSTLDAARGLKDAARAMRERAAQRLKAGVLPSIGAYFMPRLRERLRARMPEIGVDLVEGSSRELLAQLRAGELDMVVASRGEAAGVEARALFEETLWICSGPGDPLMKDAAPIAPEALKGRSLLTLSPDFHLTTVVRDIANLAGAALSEEYRGASLDAIRQMAANGSGVAVLPSLYALGEAIRDPAFRLRRIDHPNATHPVLLYWRASAPDQDLFDRLGEEMIAEKLAIRAERAPQFRL